MASIYDVDTNELITKLAEELKKVPELEKPVWVDFVKTGVFKDRTPADKGWWYMRIASILRKICIKGPIGVSKLRTLYGGKKHRGMEPEKFFRGSGSIIRKALQRLEKAGLIKAAQKGQHKGRIITPKGRSLLDKTATQIQHSKPRKVEQPVQEEPKEEKLPEIKGEKKQRKPRKQKEAKEPQKEAKNE